MGKKYKYSSFDPGYLGATLSSWLTHNFKGLEKIFGGDLKKIVEFTDRVYKHGTEGLSKEITDFVSPPRGPGHHYLTGEILASYEPSQVFLDEHGGSTFIKMRLGFNADKGGWPALILEYGDSGSPMRMPNEKHLFMWKAMKNNGIFDGHIIDESGELIYDYALEILAEETDYDVARHRARANQN